MKHSALLFCGSLVALSFAVESRAQTTGDAVPAAAQADAARLDDIVVTARRRSEDMQKVPVAIAAATGEALQDRAVTRFTDLERVTPGLTIAMAANDPNSPIVALRGQKQDVIQIATDPAVGVYIDGVYTGGSQGGNIADIVDVDRVEVLKGPQGTLYGRNTTGGAINIYTKPPTDRLEGELTLGGGTYDRRLANVIVNTPIDDGGKVALRVVGSFVAHDGYANQRYLSGANQPDVGQKDPDSQNSKSIRGALRIKPSEMFDIILRADYSSSKNDGAPIHPIYVQPTNATALTAAAIQFTGKPAAQITAADRTAAFNILNSAVNSDLLTVYNARRQFSDGEVYGASATITANIGELEFKAISAYRHAGSQRANDSCACGVDLFSSANNSLINVYSQELQLNGRAFDNRLKYVFGAYYGNKSGRSREANTFFSPLNLPSVPQVNAYKMDSYSAGVFTQATFAVTSAINLTGGLRYTKEKKTLDISATTPLGCSLPPAGSFPAFARLIAPCLARVSKPDDAINYLATVDWAPFPGVMVYAKTSSGYLGGGVNVRVNQNPASLTTYDPERVRDYEVGLKSTLFDRRVRFNIDYYHTILKGAQRSAVVQSPAGSLTVQTNAASAKIDGVEAELNVIPFPHATLSFGGAYTDPRYSRYVIGGIDQSFLRFLVTSKWSYTAGASYTVPATFGAVKGQVDWMWRSDYDTFPADSPGAVTGFTPAGVGILGAGTPDSARIQKGFGLLNGSITVNIDTLDMTIRAFVTNILDKHYGAFGFGAVNGGLGVASVVAGEPRVAGLNVTKRF